jgi:hypothetical protein
MEVNADSRAERDRLHAVQPEGRCGHASSTVSRPVGTGNRLDPSWGCGACPLASAYLGSQALQRCIGLRSGAMESAASQLEEALPRGHS